MFQGSTRRNGKGKTHCLCGSVTHSVCNLYSVVDSGVRRLVGVLLTDGGLYDRNLILYLYEKLKIRWLLNPNKQGLGFSIGRD